LSKSEPLTFDAWVADEFARTGGFTALVVLVEIGELSVTPLRSTWFHVLGTDLDWTGVAELLSGAGAWDGALFAPRTDRAGGPLPDSLARLELRDLGDRVIADRAVVNDEHFFDRHGRRLRVDEVPAQ
jgi:hypothetical protein